MKIENLTRHLYLLAATSAFLLLTGCDEKRQSNGLLSREQALEQAGIRMPIPESAHSVQFKLTGSTQRWRLFLTYTALPEEIEIAITRELEKYLATEKRIFGDEPAMIYFEGREVPKGLLKSAPRWWRDVEQEAAYYAGVADTEAFGPMFWLNKSRTKVYFFHKF